MMNFTIFHRLRGILIYATWIFIWYGIYIIVGKEILIVSPFDVFKNIFHKIFQIQYWIICMYSIFRIMMGYFLGIFFGGMFALISYKNKFIYDFLYPLIVILKSTPVASFIILALVWIKTDNVAIFIVTIMVIPIVWTNICEGLNSVDNKIIEVSNIFEFSIFNKIRYIYMQAIMPYVYSALTVSLGLAWKSGISAEIISMPNISIGTSIYNSKIYLETLELFSWTITVIIISICIEKIIKFFIKNLFNNYMKEI